MKDKMKDKIDLLEEYARKYNGTDTAIFDQDLRKYCNDNDIIEKDVDKFKEDFRMFLYENRTFDAGFGRHYLLEQFKL
jgi:hypothetical protein